MKCNFLIKLPNRSTTCVTIDENEQRQILDECNESPFSHKCALGSACRLGTPCCASDIHSHLVSTLYGLPTTSFYIEAKPCDVYDASGLLIQRDFEVQVLFKLLGGKGGFGALLKGQGSRKKPSENIDSCRNLQGQRIRTVRLEQQAKDWQVRQEYAAQDPSVNKLPKVATPSEPASAPIVKRIDTKKIKAKVAQAFKNQIEDSKANSSASSNEAKEKLRQELIVKCLDIYEI